MAGFSFSYGQGIVSDDIEDNKKIMIFTAAVFGFGIVSMISTSFFPFFKHNNETWI